MTDAQYQVTRHTVSVNGVHLYYEKLGKGDPLLFLHGWTQASGYWKPFTDQFASENEVYSIDLRGHGRSSPLTKDFSIQNAARDIRELIQKLQLKSVRAIGFSYGGLILLELVANYKVAIESIVVIGTSYQYDGSKAQKEKPAFTYENLDSSFKTYLMQQHAYGEKQIKSMFDPMLNYRINLAEERLKTIQARVLIINGDSDEIADIKQAVQMRQLIPRSALLIIPNAGHLAINETNKDPFINTTKTFFTVTDSFLPP